MTSTGMSSQPHLTGMTAAPSMAAKAHRAGPPSNGAVCALFAVDIVGFTRADRDDDIRMYLHEELYRILEKAFDGSGIPWAECFREGRGDGVLVVVPPDLPAFGIIDPLPDRLRALIRRHNHVSRDAAEMQLRVAAHVGPVEHDGQGFIGSDVNLTFRMLEARAFKHIARVSDAEVALIVSHYAYDSFVRRYPSLLDPDNFRSTVLQTKNTRVRAWVYLPGESSQDAKSNTDQVMTVFKAALTHMDTSVRETARIRNLANITDAEVAVEEN
jgi:class 3 adenylate cyclase